MEEDTTDNVFDVIEVIFHEKSISYMTNRLYVCFPLYYFMI